MAHVREVARSGKPAYEVRWRDGAKFRQRTFPARRDAERFALRVEASLGSGAPTDAYVKRGKTVAEVVEASVAASAYKLKPRTVASYRQVYDNHVLPAFGTRRIATVTSADVETWVGNLRASGLSAATVRNVFVALNKVMRYAVRHRYIAANPCAGTDLPRARHDETFEARFLSPAEVERLAAALDDAHPYGLLVRFAAYTGLRAGEVAGLRVRDVNLLRREVSVRRTMQRVRGGWVEGSPKSARSTRTVPLLRDDLLHDLATYLGEHPARSNPDAPLWPGRAVGSHAVDWERPFDHQSFYRWYFRPAAARVGVGAVRFHDLRHTAASIWLAAGVEIYKVSRWLGHANISTTDSIYAHLYATDYSADAARLATFVRGLG
ncbi:tyrosine-type recombinase/integrase [Quadrisphaera granulorum]|nr:site-specific integrase [Quadrisphaera granulorum]